MTLAERVFLVLAAGAFVHQVNVSGWCDEPRGKLELVAESADDTSMRGEALVITLMWRNSGQEPLEIYHPESIHMVSPCWSLKCRVTLPNRDVLILAPEIMFARYPLVKREHFRQLGPGDAMSIQIHLQADDPSATHTPSGWVGLIPISKAVYHLLPAGLIKRLYGIRGRFFFIGGDEIHLAIRDLMADVFNRPGEYRLEFEYENDCTRYLDFSAEGKGSLKPVKRAWSGRLSDEVVITIQD